MKIKTRFAPSSTGALHIGSVRTALYSWLFAKRYNGSFVLRIEDTDTKRSDNKYVGNILKTLQWLGLIWDDGPYFQSQRLNIYKNKINEMLNLGQAYKCYCSIDRLKKLRLNQILNGDKPSYDRKCRYHKGNSACQDYVIRFKNPISGQVIVHDQIRGKIIFNNSELDDLVIQRRNGMPTYNFCVVIDDLDMNITHVIRGEDHINNTPRQINILKALNAKIPYYAHVSMVIHHDKSNFSKRKNSFNVLDYKMQGFFKESILNYLLKLGWSHQDQEIFSVDEMKQLFSIRNISKSPSEFNQKKLLWLNHYYLNNTSVDATLVKQFRQQLKKCNIVYNEEIDLIKIIELIRSRCNTVRDLVLQSKYFFEETKIFDYNLYKKYTFDQYDMVCNYIYNKLSNMESWNAKNIIYTLQKTAKKFFVLLKNIFMSLRIAITGSDVSPSIGTIMEILGKRITLNRIHNFIQQIKI